MWNSAGIVRGKQLQRQRLPILYKHLSIHKRNGRPQEVLRLPDSFCPHCCSLGGTANRYGTNSNGYSDLSVSPGSPECGQQGRMVGFQAGLGCSLALAPSAAILIPSQLPQGRRQVASSQGQEKSYPVSQKIWRRHAVWLRRKTKGHCVELLLKNRAKSGCLYCQPQTKAQGLSLTSFAGR